jgi:hypothetical protein
VEGFVFSESFIDRDTILAFLKTEYHVLGECPYTLRIGEPSPALSVVSKRYGAESSAFITAYNPGSQTVDEVVNAERHASLRRTLITQNLAFVEGVGKHPSNGWPGEPSFLILGISLDWAKELSIELKQDAFVWSGPDWVPQLILLR